MRACHVCWRKGPRRIGFGGERCRNRSDHECVRVAPPLLAHPRGPKADRGRENGQPAPHDNRTTSARTPRSNRIDGSSPGRGNALRAWSFPGDDTSRGLDESLGESLDCRRGPDDRALGGNPAPQAPRCVPGERCNLLNRYRETPPAGRDLKDSLPKGSDGSSPPKTRPLQRPDRFSLVILFEGDQHREKLVPDPAKAFTKKQGLGHRHPWPVAAARRPRNASSAPARHHAPCRAPLPELPREHHP